MRKKFNTGGVSRLEAPGKARRSAASTARGNHEALQLSTTSFALCNPLPVFPALLVLLRQQGVSALRAGRGCSVQAFPDQQQHRETCRRAGGNGEQAEALVHPALDKGLELGGHLRSCENRR